MRESIWNDERGQSFATNLFVYIFVFLIVFSVWKFGIPVLKHMLFSEFVEKQVNWDRENRTEPLPFDTLHDIIETKARKYGAVIPKGQIKMDNNDGAVSIKINYYFPVNLYLFKFDWNFKVDKTTTVI